MKFFARTSLYWRWLGMGIAATVLGFLVIPTHNWEGQPVRSWLSFTLFPYGMIIIDYPAYDLHPRFRTLLMWSRVVFWLGQFPTYGLLLAWASRNEKLRLWGYTTMIMHTIAACIAGAMFYRWISWSDQAFTAFVGMMGIGMALFIIGQSVAKRACRHLPRRTTDQQISADHTKSAASYWRGLGWGITVTVLTFFWLYPKYNWDGQPMRSWLSFTLFPYWVIIADYPLFGFHLQFEWLLGWGRMASWLGQFPTYGLLWVWASRNGRLRLWGGAMLLMHIMAGCLAGAMFYKWISWSNQTFTAFVGIMGIGMALFIIGRSVARMICRWRDCLKN